MPRPTKKQPLHYKEFFKNHGISPMQGAVLTGLSYSHFCNVLNQNFSCSPKSKAALDTLVDKIKAGEVKHG